MGENNSSKWKDEGLDCLVLDEFLIPNPKTIQGVTTSNDDSISTKDAETISKLDIADTTKAIEDANGQQNKNDKKRGRNKKRPGPLKFQRSSKLCPILVDVSPERGIGPESNSSTLPKCTFPNCQFQHDVKAFLENKTLDIGDECWIYKNYGRCQYGLACRFGNSHITVEDENYRNKIDKSLYSENKAQKHHRELNHLTKDLQMELRRKEYEFKVADKIVDDEFKARQERQESDTNSDKFNNENEAKNVNETNGLNCNEANLEMNSESEPKKLKIERDLGVQSSEANEILNSVRKKIDWENKLYLAPLTTVGNLPFRRICKKFGADITCGEMAMSLQLLQGHQPEWALVQRHESEDIFGIQLCGPSPQQMARVAQLVDDGHINCDFVDINLGCPIDLVYSRGMGSGLMARKKPLEVMVRSMANILARKSQTPLTIKMRTGVYADKHIAHNLAPLSLKSWGASMVCIHGRSREQRYTRSADWKYIQNVAEAANEDAIVNCYGGTVPIYGNGDIMNYEDYNNFKATAPQVSGVMIARGALIKPWVFKEIKEQQHWDISASERLDMIKDYVNYGLEHWGSDDKGVETTRRFLLEWLSFLHRYVPHGILASPPQRINERVPKYFRGRTDIETLLSSPVCEDWIQISSMFLGKPPDDFRFEPKHRAHAYRQS